MRESYHPYKATLFGVSLLALLITPSHAADIAAGKKLADKLCARCHAVEKTGPSPNAEAPPFRTFAKKWPVESLEEALAEGIVVGKHVMPEFELQPDQISKLLGYIATLAKPVSK